MGQDYPMALPPSAYLPSYIPTIVYYRGAVGDDVYQATARSTAPDAADLWHTQSEKAAAIAYPLTQDITRERGWIAAGEPYHAKPAAPTATALQPSSYSLATNPRVPIYMIVTGTGFTPWSRILWGGYEERTDYISPTQLGTIVKAQLFSVPTTVPVSVIDHGMVATPDLTFTVSA